MSTCRLLTVVAAKKKSEVKTEAASAVPDFSAPAPAAVSKPERGPANGVSARPAAREVSVPGLTPEDAQDLLGDPHVQQVVKAFKGKIVDVKKIATPAPKAAETE